MNKKNIMIIITVVLIILCTTFFIIEFNKKVTDKLYVVSKDKITELTYSFINESVNKTKISDEEINNIIIVNKNDNNEILGVDFDLKEAYKELDKITGYLQENIKNLEKGKINSNYHDEYLKASKKGLYLMLPIGIASNHTYFNSLGPKIPARVNFSSTLLTNIKTKVTNYGVNNALIEIYAYIWVNAEIISPIKNEKIKTEYDMLLAARTINGKVPSFYNNAYEQDSKIISVPIK